MSIDMSLCRKMPRASMRISTDVTRMPVRCQTSDFKKGVSWPFSACVSLLMNMQRTLQHICQPVYKKCAIICKHLPLQAPHYRSQNTCQTACKKACQYPCQLRSQKCFSKHLWAHVYVSRTVRTHSIHLYVSTSGVHQEECQSKFRYTCQWICQKKANAMSVCMSIHIFAC
jgi:hypothetical protein